MVLVEWRDDFRIGIDSIDFEHRQMIQLLNDLHESLSGDCSKDEVIGFLGEVFARISAHFALEEKIMRARRYDQLEDHKEDHERLLDGIRDIMDGVEQGRISTVDEELPRHLEPWFSVHFKTKDARLHRFLGDH